MPELEDQSISDVQKLIRLKRFESPPEGAVDDFLDEFQRRQRSEVMTGSSLKLFFERLSTYMSSFGKQKWAFAALGAYACVMLFFIVRPSESPITSPNNSGGGTVPINHNSQQVIEEPTYDPKVNRARPQPKQAQDVKVF